MFGPEVGCIYTEIYCPFSTWLTDICFCVAVVINLVCREITYKCNHFKSKHLNIFTCNNSILFYITFNLNF
jgi:uncharacterized membrane protein SirB2